MVIQDYKDGQIIRESDLYFYEANKKRTKGYNSIKELVESVNQPKQPKPVKTKQTKK